MQWGSMGFRFNFILNSKRKVYSPKKKKGKFPVAITPFTSLNSVFKLMQIEKLFQTLQGFVAELIVYFILISAEGTVNEAKGKKLSSVIT